MRPVNLARGLAAAALVLPALTVVAPAPAHAATGCYPFTYGVKYKILKSSHAPAVTHAFTLPLAPGGSYSQMTSVRRITTVTAGVSIEAGATVSAGKVLAKAEAYTNVTLQASGSHTRETAYEERITQTNNTRANKTYVVFHGTMRYNGTYVKKTCNYGTYMVVRKYGRWKSWVVHVKGTVRCDLEARNAVARKAKRLYC
jgi:hypothetical protein